MHPVTGVAQLTWFSMQVDIRSTAGIEWQMIVEECQQLPMPSGFVFEAHDWRVK